MEKPDTPWIEAPEVEGEISIRYRQIYSHALSFEFVGDDGEMEIEADVKWDGCINWSTSDDCAYHFCEPADVQKLARAFDRAWHLTAENLPTWDRDCEPRKLTAKASA